MKKEFIGGKFPKQIKENLKERAEKAGLSMQEYLEKIYLQHLDEEEEGVFSEESLRKIIQEELKTQAPKEVEMPIEEKVIPVPDPIENVDAPEEIEKEEVEDLETDIDSDEAKIADLGGLEAILPELLAGELNCSILNAWEGVQETGDNYPEVALLETLAENLQVDAEKPVKYTCEDSYTTILPDHITAILGRIILDASKEVGQHPEKARLFPLLADLFNDTADRLYLEARAFDLAFDREEYFYLDKMLQKVNKSRSADERFADLQSFIRYKIGEGLEEGASGFWGVGDEEMAALGKRLQQVALNKVIEE